jgi:glycolate oxidase iron-sulfur subunit
MQLQARTLKEIETCVHCGLCLPACPTYQELGNEADSPRGRIHLITHLQSGLLAPEESVLGHLDLCLDCRACETACPSGVKYGAIIEDARGQLELSRPRRWSARWVRRLLFRDLLPHPKRLAALARLARGAQWLRLDRLAIRTGLTRLLPKGVGAMAGALTIPDTFGRDHLPERLPAQGEQRWRVAFMPGCVMDVMFGPTNLASVRVLQRNGCEVVIPPAQTCCGALQHHGGDVETARTLARQNVDAFLAAGVDFVIINAAGCGSALKEYHHLLADDPIYSEKAAVFVTKVKDITEFLGSIELAPPTTPVALRVAYQDACHLAHGQRIRLQPRHLLRQIPGLELVELPDGDTCCGSAGIYNLLEPEMSMAILDRKAAAMAQSGAVVVASANPGCIMQLRLGAQRKGLAVEVLHVVDLLDRAYTPAKEG